MIRLLTGFSEAQVTWLRREAKRLGIGVSELLRRIVDGAREEKVRRGP